MPILVGTVFQELYYLCVELTDFQQKIVKHILLQAILLNASFIIFSFLVVKNCEQLFFFVYSKHTKLKLNFRKMAGINVFLCFLN